MIAIFLWSTVLIQPRTPRFLSQRAAKRARGTGAVIAVISSVPREWRAALGCQSRATSCAGCGDGRGGGRSPCDLLLQPLVELRLWHGPNLEKHGGMPGAAELRALAVVVAEASLEPEVIRLSGYGVDLTGQRWHVEAVVDAAPLVGDGVCDARSGVDLLPERGGTRGDVRGAGGDDRLDDAGGIGRDDLQVHRHIGRHVQRREALDVVTGGGLLTLVVERPAELLADHRDVHHRVCRGARGGIVDEAHLRHRQTEQ